MYASQVKREVADLPALPGLGASVGEARPGGEGGGGGGGGGTCQYGEDGPLGSGVGDSVETGPLARDPMSVAVDGAGDDTPPPVV